MKILFLIAVVIRFKDTISVLAVWSIVRPSLNTIPIPPIPNTTITGRSETVSPNPPGLAGVAVVSENMELVGIVLTLWISGGMILSVFWLLSLE